MPKFDVAIYNQKVRELVAEGEQHPRLNDDWADIHYYEVNAPTAEAAREKMANSHPASHGYVIESIDEIEDD